MARSVSSEASSHRVREMERTKVTLRTLNERYQAGTPITMVTAYDATFARLFDEAGVDTLLVGDSLGNVIQGQSTTIPVTLDDIIYHTRAVARGTRYAHIIADLPFGTYGASLQQGVDSAVRLMKEGHAESVKIEGGREHVELVQTLTRMGVPVVGHLGLTPQSYHMVGGYRVQGRDEASAQKMIEDAIALQDAGAWCIVLEMVPKELGERITKALRIPTVGIGAGNQTSGQVLVCYDYLGLFDGFKPKFVKRYTDLGAQVREATKAYIQEVQSRHFPDDPHSFD